MTEVALNQVANKVDLGEIGWVTWTRLIWLRTGTSGGLL
jgi:hypothetical protein